MIRQYSIEELKQIAENFKNELEISAAGKQSSLPFLKHTLPEPKHTRKNPAQIIVIGGSTYKTVTIQPNSTIPDFNKIKTGETPAFTSINSFMGFILNLIDPNMSEVALNFAFALIPVSRDGRMDGVLQQGSKEHVFEGMIGKTVGATIEEEYFAKKGKKISVTVGNDTICLLLSGLTKYPLKELAAVIVGTGFNSAIVLDDKTVVNLESANFDKFPQSSEGKIVDAESTAPGTALFEKEISGEYLYKHYNSAMKNNNSHKVISSTDEMNSLATKGDRLASSLLTRSATLVAAHVAGTLKYLGNNRVFVSEGSLFWKGDSFYTKITTLIKTLAPHHSTNFIEINNSDVLGCMKLLSI